MSLGRSAATATLPASATLLGGCGLLLGYPNTNFGTVQDAQNKRINDRERPTEPESLRLPTNYEATGALYDAPERNSDWRALKDVLFGPRITKRPDQGELPRCLDDEVYSCSATSGCACRIVAPPRPAPAAVTPPPSPARNGPPAPG